jgi:hypothetical protein
MSVDIQSIGGVRRQSLASFWNILAIAKGPYFYITKQACQGTSFGKILRQPQGFIPRYKLNNQTEPPLIRAMRQDIFTNNTK